jgi:hypothetical protein
MTDSKKEQGFLFNIVSNIGNGHQVQVAFNLPVGAGKKDMDAMFDEYFAALKRQEARLTLPTIEQQVVQQAALVEGVKKSVERLRESPVLVNGKRTSQAEAAFHQAQTQADADQAKLDLLKRNLELTAKEAEVEIPECRIRANS